jgi:hypothetical protein
MKRPSKPWPELSEPPTRPISRKRRLVVVVIMVVLTVVLLGLLALDWLANSPYIARYSGRMCHPILTNYPVPGCD